MNFGKESKSEEYKKMFWGGGGVGGEEEGDSNIGIRLFIVLMLYIKFQVPCSSGSLVLTQTKGVTDR